MRGRAVAVVAVVALAVACNSSSSNNATQSPSSTNSNAPSAQGSSGSGKPVVDLVLTGKRALTMMGSAGTCAGHPTPPVFAFSATEADFAGIGSQGFFLTEDLGSHEVSIKWLVPDANVAIAEVLTAGGYSVSTDHLSIIIDVGTRDISNPEHIRGTITCPVT